VAAAADLVAAEAATAAGAVAIAHVQRPEPRLFVLVAASRRLFLLNREAIVRYSAAIASRHKRVVRAAAAVVDAAATTAAVAADAVDVTNVLLR
jgi:alkyl hydroperoxide reductase subunit AhpC